MRSMSKRPQAISSFTNKTVSCNCCIFSFMIDCFAIISKGGLVIWTLVENKSLPLDSVFSYFIKSLVQGTRDEDGENTKLASQLDFHWTLDKELSLIFLVFI